MMRLKAVTAYVKEVIRTKDFFFYFGRQKLVKIISKHDLRIFSSINTGDNFLRTFYHVALHNKGGCFTVILQLNNIANPCFQNYKVMYRAVGKAFVGFAQYFMDCFVLCQDAFYICFIKVPKNNNSIVLLFYFYTCGMFIHVPQQTFIKE